MKDYCKWGMRETTHLQMPQGETNRSHAVLGANKKGEALGLS
jgi:hypothetical protein